MTVSVCMIWISNWGRCSFHDIFSFLHNENLPFKFFHTICTNLPFQFSSQAKMYSVSQLFYVY